MKNIELYEGECIIQEIKGDYWKGILCFYTQIRGKIFITNQRIIFKSFFGEPVEIGLNNIESVSLCMIGGLLRIIPTGIKVVTKDSKAYMLSVLSRKKYIEVIKDAMSSCK